MGQLKLHNFRNKDLDKFICRHISNAPIQYLYVQGYQFKASKNAIHIFSKKYFEELLHFLVKDPVKYEEIFEKALMTMLFSFYMKNINRQLNTKKCFNKEDIKCVYFKNTHCY